MKHRLPWLAIAPLLLLPLLIVSGAVLVLPQAALADPDTTPPVIDSFAFFNYTVDLQGVGGKAEWLANVTDFIDPNTPQAKALIVGDWEYGVYSFSVLLRSVKSPATTFKSTAYVLGCTNPADVPASIQSGSIVGEVPFGADAPLGEWKLDYYEAQDYYGNVTRVDYPKLDCNGTPLIVTVIDSGPPAPPPSTKVTLAKVHRKYATLGRSQYQKLDAHAAPVYKDALYTMESDWDWWNSTLTTYLQFSVYKQKQAKWKLVKTSPLIFPSSPFKMSYKGVSGRYRARVTVRIRHSWFWMFIQPSGLPEIRWSKEVIGARSSGYVYWNVR